MSTNGTNGKARWAAIAGVLLTALLAAGAVTVQWGVVTTKLDQVEKRLDELIVEARAIRAAFADLERRVSFLEGRAAAGRDGGRPGQ